MWRYRSMITRVRQEEQEEPINIYYRAHTYTNLYNRCFQSSWVTTHTKHTSGSSVTLELMVTNKGCEVLSTFFGTNSMRITGNTTL